MKKFAPIALIILLAFVLRFYQLTDNPPSLNWDEVSHGYNAYSILKTGKDEWGVAWPQIFRAYGDYKLPVYIYLTVVSEAFLGLNELAVRLPSALAGTLSILFTFLLVKKLFKNESLALLAALLTAVEPWGLFLSRVAVEANLASFFIISGAYFFLCGLKRREFLLISLFFFGLSLFTYNSARIFVPLLLLILLWIYRNSWQRSHGKYKLAAALVFLFFIGAMIVSLFTPSGQARYRWVSLLDEGAIQRINEARGESKLLSPLPRLIYNKGTYFIAQFGKNYINHFSPAFLFFKGGSHYQFNLLSYGLIYPIQIPFILCGLWYLFKKRKENSSRLIFAWLIFAPIAGSLTRDSPHTLRAIVLLPIPQLLTALGLFWVLGVLRNKKLQLGFILIYLLFIIYYLLSFLRIYFGFYRTNYSWAWQYGHKEVVQYIKQNYQRYDRIIITKKYGEPHEFILFYWPWEPEKYRSDASLVRYFQTDWYWVDSFAKFEFVNDWEVKLKFKVQSSKFKVLLITSPGNYPEGWKKLETINFLDGKPAFEILEF